MVRKKEKTYSFVSIYGLTIIYLHAYFLTSVGSIGEVRPGASEILEPALYVDRHEREHYPQDSRSWVYGDTGLYPCIQATSRRPKGSIVQHGDGRSRGHGNGVCINTSRRKIKAK
jgi:hypothetical protein